MTFIGENGVPAPQLKQLPRDGFAAMDWMSMYVDSLTIVYLLLHECHLVHGDLSEYNLLRGPDGNVHVIDFGQAVDTSHPEHFEYLVRDLETVNSFFHRQGVATLPVDELMALCLQPIQEIEELHKLSSDRGDYGDGDSYLDLRNTATSHVEVPYYEEGCRPPPLPAELPGAIRLTPTALDVIRRIIDMKT
jgi:serine/threonine protein kinase